MATGFVSSGLCVMAVTCELLFLLVVIATKKRQRDREDEKEREID